MIDKANKPKHLMRALISITIVVLLVYISSFAFKRFDLTEEKRHSLTPTTIEILEELDETLFVKVYLKGDYPAEFKRLEKSVREKLDEMKAYAGANLEYEFINPFESENQEQKDKMYKKLMEDGLEPTDLLIDDKNGQSLKILFPGAMLTYKGKTKPLQILKSNSPVPNLKMINNSINNLEYEFSRIISQIMTNKVGKIAFVTGHGETDILPISEAMKILDIDYDVSRIELKGGLNDLSEMYADTIRYRRNLYDMIIISDPDSMFNDQNKFLLDQYLVRGGKVMLFIDPMEVNLDSLRANQETMAVARDIGLADMIYDYGIRLDKNILIDQVCAPIELQVGQMGNRKQYKRYGWFYSPTLIPQADHPIVRNIDPIYTEFTSSISIIDKEYLDETVLLTTSEYTKALKQPVRINAGIVGVDIDFTKNNSPNLPVAVLVQGKFKSAFIDRLPPEFISNTKLTFQAESDNPGALLVVSDGHVITNKLTSDKQSYYELDYDRYLKRKVYGNKEFLLNATNYMMNDNRLINLRSRSISLRPLNLDIIKNKKGLIQILNMVLPVLLITILGIVMAIIRKRKYAKS